MSPSRRPASPSPASLPATRSCSGTIAGAFSVGVTGDAQNLLGAGSFIAGAGNSFDYSTITGAGTYVQTNAGANIAPIGTSTLEFSINGAASAGNSVAIDTGAGDATAAVVTSSDTSTGAVAVTANNNTLNLLVNGTAYSVTLT